MDENLAASAYPGAGGGFPGGAYGPYGAAGYGGGYGGSQNILPPPPSAGAPSRPSNFHTISLGLLVLLPALIFFGISLGYALLYHQLPGLCWCFTGLCILLSAMFMLAKPKREGPKFWFNLGGLCLIATVTANLIGQWNMRKHFATYWAYEGQREYSNVLPGEPALNHLDAGKIFFSADARVDVSAAGGLTEGQKRYCVAPIVGKSPTSTVEYWAAGVNCCSHAGEFTCDDVGNRDARAGLVYLDFGIERQYLEKFRRAARETGAAHGMSPDQDALFMAWVVDPDMAQHSYWKYGMGFLTGASLIYLGVSTVAGLILHFGRRAPVAKSKLESRSL